MCADDGASLFQARTRPAHHVGHSVCGGFSRSLQFSSLNTLAYADIDHADLGKANGLYTVLQQLSLALGVAAAAFVLDGRLWWSGRADVVADDFSFAFLVVSIVSAVSVFFYLKLDARAGASISGQSDD